MRKIHEFLFDRCTFLSSKKNMTISSQFIVCLSLMLLISCASLPSSTEGEEYTSLLQTDQETTKDTISEVIDSNNMSGIIASQKYLPKNLEPLPLNEEAGEEWLAYQEMMRGNFSLVEVEYWTSLQKKYESSLLEGNGLCGWSYFLMDFNQDGNKELFLKFNEKEYNDTASFRYEDGRIKMWGSYNSADSHGYMIPLINGNILSVYWYQNDWSGWIEQLDSECNFTVTKGYESLESEEEMLYQFQDYSPDGQPCGGEIALSEKEWKQIMDIIEGLYIPEDAWQTCSAFTPASDRPTIPSIQYE